MGAHNGPSSSQALRHPSSAAWRLHIVWASKGAGAPTAALLAMLQQQDRQQNPLKLPQARILPLRACQRGSGMHA